MFHELAHGRALLSSATLQLGDQALVQGDRGAYDVNPFKKLEVCAR
jgi:hypothetical protein